MSEDRSTACTTAGEEQAEGGDRKQVNILKEMNGDDRSDQNHQPRSPGERSF